jgi:hypothetical protein
MLANIDVPRGDEELYKSNSSCCKPKLIHGCSKLLRMFSARLAVEKSAILNKHRSIGSTFDGIMSEVALLDYQAVVHEIFIELLMNSDMHFCQENILELKAYLQIKIEYFTVWHEAMSKRKVNTRKPTSPSSQHRLGSICDLLSVDSLALLSTSCKTIGQKMFSMYQYCIQTPATLNRHFLT